MYLKKPSKDYVEFCQAGAHDKEEKLDILEPEDRLYPKELQLEGSSDGNIIIDVRLGLQKKYFFVENIYSLIRFRWKKYLFR